MELFQYFRSIIDQDPCAVVICNLEHEIIYMNPSAQARYAKRGGFRLIGKNLLHCHNEQSQKAICRVMEWFAESPKHNRIFTFHNPKENMDVYMVALRDEDKKLIGYYEKHESRVPESGQTYSFAE